MAHLQPESRRCAPAEGVFGEACPSAATLATSDPQAAIRAHRLLSPVPLEERSRHGSDAIEAVAISRSSDPLLRLTERPRQAVPLSPVRADAVAIGLKRCARPGYYGAVWRDGVKRVLSVCRPWKGQRRRHFAHAPPP